MNYGVNWRRHRPRVSFIWNNLWPRLASCLSSRGGAQQGIYTVSFSCRPLPLDVNPPTSTKNTKYPGFSIRHCRSWYETRYNIHVTSLSNNSRQLGSFVHIYLVTLVDCYVTHWKERFSFRFSIDSYRFKDTILFISFENINNTYNEMYIRRKIVDILNNLVEKKVSQLQSVWIYFQEFFSSFIVERQLVYLEDIFISGKVRDRKDIKIFFFLWKLWKIYFKLIEFIIDLKIRVSSLQWLFKNLKIKRMLNFRIFFYTQSCTTFQSFKRSTFLLEAKTIILNITEN